MIRLPRALAGTSRPPARFTPLTTRSRVLWTVGNLFMLLGVIVLLYVGGLYTTDEYGRYAARGDTDLPAPAAFDGEDIAEPPPFTPSTPAAPFVAPVLNSGVANGGQLNAQPVEHKGLVSRLVIPSIKLDSKVVEVGWELLPQGDNQVPTWDVAKYAVGQHHGSANPGENGNIVLAGHVGGYGHVFRDLFYVHPGEEVILYSGGQEFRYTIKERLIVTEEGVSDEQRAENAKLIEPTNSEVVTMVTCWPATGPKKFTQRVVVRAVPYATSAAAPEQSSWSIR